MIHLFSTIVSFGLWLALFIDLINGAGTAFQENHAILHRIAFGSCRKNKRNADKIWKLIQSYQPNHLTLLGDLFYADRENGDDTTRKPTEEILKNEYDTLLHNPNFQDLLSSLSGMCMYCSLSILLSFHSIIFPSSITLDGWSATYDDHDYAADNSDKHHPLRNISQQLFWEFAQSSKSKLSHVEEKPSGVYSSFSQSVKVPMKDSSPYLFTYKMILLDNRSNKDRKGQINGDFLGDEQWKWLQHELGLNDTNNVAPDLIILGTGLQVVKEDKVSEEVWGQFPKARERWGEIWMIGGSLHLLKEAHII